MDHRTAQTTRADLEKSAISIGAGNSGSDA
jgi:hypothetical protein